MYLWHIESQFWHEVDESRYALAEVIRSENLLLGKLFQVVSEVLLNLGDVLVKHFDKQAIKHV